MAETSRIRSTERRTTKRFVIEISNVTNDRTQKLLSFIRKNLEVKSDENVEPDSTSDQPSLKPQKNESKPEPEDEQNVQPDSTTTDKMITNGEISG